MLKKLQYSVPVNCVMYLMLIHIRLLLSYILGNIYHPDIYEPMTYVQICYSLVDYSSYKELFFKLDRFIQNQVIPQKKDRYSLLLGSLISWHTTVVHLVYNRYIIHIVYVQQCCTLHNIAFCYLRLQ